MRGFNDWFRRVLDKLAALGMIINVHEVTDNLCVNKLYKWAVLLFVRGIVKWSDSLRVDKMAGYRVV